MTGEERQQLRLAIDAARRDRLRRVCESGWENPSTGYRYGCRCDRCRHGHSAANRARRRRQREREAAAAG